MNAVPAHPGEPPEPPATPARPAAVLSVILAVQLMNSVDITVMNMALPQVQRGLDIAPTTLSWVINAYTLAYGGLLLLGGRLGDILGHRRVLLIGVTVFAAASLAGGLAQEPWSLLAARAVQGAGAALTAPCTLALIVRVFRGPAERTRALGISVMASGIGTAGGLLAGGLLTELGSWRAVLAVNVPIGIVVLLLASRVLPSSGPTGGRLDVGGALTGTGGTAALVYGFVRAAGAGWTDPVALAAFAVAVVLLAALVAVESRHAAPVLPLGLFRDRDRSGGFLVFVCSGAAMFGSFFFLTQFVQTVLGLPPFAAGLAFLPMALAMIVVPRVVAPRIVARFGARPSMVAGLLCVALGMVWLSRLTASTGYLGGVLGPMLLAGTGVGLLNAPLAATILGRVAPADSGAASGVLQTVGMVGGSVGTAILVTVFGAAVRRDGGMP
ncbi:MAG: MFS transporter, partial [Actinocatenispora sp.]